MKALHPAGLIVLALSAFGCGPEFQSIPRAEPPPATVESQAIDTQPGETPAPPQDPAAPPQTTPFSLHLPGTGVQTISAWRPPPYQVPWVIRPGDHFYFARPIPSGEVNWPNAQYRYGSTFFGLEATHTGVDLGAARGTSVLAMGPGEVVWAGTGLYRGVPRADDPYGLAIAIRHDFGHGGLPLYTAYAHLQSIGVWVGQRVEISEPIGKVGETGHATGAHLHFEVRLGENGYFATRNPELWMVPPEGWGVLAAQVSNTSGQPLPEQRVRIISLDSGQIWEVWSYAPDTVIADEIYRENLVISDLPAGPYRIELDYVGRTYSAEILVLAGQTNVVAFRGRYGFTVEPTATPASLQVPPNP